MSELKAKIIEAPLDPIALAYFAFDSINKGAQPDIVARWLARSWIACRDHIDPQSLLVLKRVSFSVLSQFPEFHPVLRTMLLEDRPYARDPAIERTDVGIGWRYSHEGRLPKVIFVENKFKPGFAGERSEVATCTICFRRSISASNVISGTYFYFDEHFLKTGETIWAEVIAFVEKNGCDVLVLHVNGNSSLLNPFLPTEDQAWYLKHLGCKIVLFGSDLMYPRYREKITRQLGHIGDYYLAMDVPPFVADELELSSKFEKPIVGSWPPQDLEIYDEVVVPRDIDVGFCGNLRGYPDRAPSIQYLIDRGVRIHSNRPNERLTHDEYIKLFKRSIMILNFASLTEDRIDPVFKENAQVKSRVFEGMAAGSVVLEKDSEYARRYFVDMKDIVLYKDMDDALEKINYLLKNRDIAEGIGRAARAAVAEKFDINAYWRYVLRRLNVSSTPANVQG